MNGTADCDRWSQADAAYALGALEPDEARAYEQHLRDCPPCAVEVSRARADATLLRGLPEAAFSTEPTTVPETLLPALARRAARETRRRRLVTVGFAAAAAACLVALLVAVWPGSASPHRAPATALAARVDTRLEASARLTSTTGGTRVDLACEYRTYNGPVPTSPLGYTLVVVDRRMRIHRLVTWDAVPNVQAVYAATTTVPLAQIARVQVTTTSGKVILELAR